MTLICSKMTDGLWKEARKATCLLRMRMASSTKRSGKPSANFLHHENERSRDADDADSTTAARNRERLMSVGPSLQSSFPVFNAQHAHRH